MPPQTVYLIRHGEVNGNILVLDRQISVAEFNNIVAHVPHESINEQGAEQARAIIPEVARYNLTCLYASPLLRAQQTARILADALHLPVVTRADLYELQPAPLTSPPDRTHTLKGAYIRSGIRLGSPFTRDAETAIHAFNRIRKAWQNLTHTNKTNFAIVGHQGIFRLLFMWIHASPGWELVRGDTSNAGVSIIRRRW